MILAPKAPLVFRGLSVQLDLKAPPVHRDRKETPVIPALRGRRDQQVLQVRRDQQVLQVRREQLALQVRRPRFRWEPL